MARKVPWVLWLEILYTISLGTAEESYLLLPLQRRDGGLIARGLLRNATLPLHGAVKDYGYFYATLQLGSPSRSFAVIVDTGSTITYVPCASCGSNCGPHHKDAAFDPVASVTSAYVGCGAQKCACGRPACGCSLENHCTYSRTYAEQSSSSGILIEDKMQLGEGGVDVVFGCETKETGEIFNQEADGIMGLGNSEVSVVNQLAKGGHIEDIFSLCFGSVEGDGALLLGAVNHTQYNVQLEYTPLVGSLAYPHYYSVQLLSITVGSTRLDVPQHKYVEGYGTVLDSGTTFTYLPTEAFEAFREEVTNFATSKGLHMTKGPDPKFYDICFGGAPHVEHADQLENVFPHLNLHFHEGVKLSMGPLNYLFMHTAEAGAYCLGVFDNGASGTLLGGITFRNILVEYDRKNKRVGFGAAPCQAIGLGQKPCPSSSAFNTDGPSMSSLGQKRSPTSASPASASALAQTIHYMFSLSEPGALWNWVIVIILGSLLLYLFVECGLNGSCKKRQYQSLSSEEEGQQLAVFSVQSPKEATQQTSQFEQ